MKDLYLALKTQIQANVTLDANLYETPDQIIPVLLYHGQWEDWKSQDPKQRKVSLPCVLVEWEKPLTIIQLGQGSQLYEPLRVRIHIIQKQFDQEDGTVDDNVNIYDLKQLVYLAINNWNPQKSDPLVKGSTWVRVGEEPDDAYNQLYHFVQSYETTYLDSSQPQYNGETSAEVENLDIDIDYNPSPFQKGN